MLDARGDSVACLFFCSGCGLYAECKAVGLVQTCRPREDPVNCKRIRRGKHPGREVLVGARAVLFKVDAQILTAEQRGEPQAARVGTGSPLPGD